MIGGGGWPQAQPVGRGGGGGVGGVFCVLGGGGGGVRVAG